MFSLQAVCNICTCTDIACTDIAYILPSSWIMKEKIINSILCTDFLVKYCCFNTCILNHTTYLKLFNTHSIFAIFAPSL